MNINTGYLYLDVDNVSYKYSFETKKYEQISVDGYEYIENYIPTDNGFVAFGSVKLGKEYDYGYGHCILYSDNNNLKEYECHPASSNLSINGNYIIYTYYDDENNEIIETINVKTEKSTELCKGTTEYYIADSYIYYAIGENIYVADCTSDDLKPVRVCKGTLCTDTYNKLIYKYDNKVYQYDFEKKSSSIVADKYQEKGNRFLYYQCSFGAEGRYCDAYILDLCIMESDADGDTDSLYIPIYQAAIIKSGHKFMKIDLPEKAYDLLIFSYSEN